MLHLCPIWCVAYNVREHSPCKGSLMFNFQFFLVCKKGNFAKSVTFQVRYLLSASWILGLCLFWIDGYFFIGVPTYFSKFHTNHIIYFKYKTYKGESQEEFINYLNRGLF